MTRSRTETIQIGTLTVTYTPHDFPGLGPRVLMTIEGNGMTCRFNVSPEQARRLAMHATLAAGEAEAIAKRNQRQKGAA